MTDIIQKKKHTNVWFCWIWNVSEKYRILLVKISTNWNPSDMMTKLLSKKKYEFYRRFACMTSTWIIQGRSLMWMKGENVGNSVHFHEFDNYIFIIFKKKTHFENIYGFGNCIFSIFQKNSSWNINNFGNFICL